MSLVQTLPLMFVGEAYNKNEHLGHKDVFRRDDGRIVDVADGGRIFSNHNLSYPDCENRKLFFVVPLTCQRDFLLVWKRLGIGTRLQQTYVANLLTSASVPMFGGSTKNTMGFPTVHQYEQLLKALPWLHWHVLSPGDSYILAPGALHMVLQEGLATSFAYDFLE